MFESQFLDNSSTDFEKIYSLGRGIKVLLFVLCRLTFLLLKDHMHQTTKLHIEMVINQETIYNLNLLKKFVCRTKYWFLGKNAAGSVLLSWPSHTWFINTFGTMIASIIDDYRSEMSVVAFCTAH